MATRLLRLALAQDYSTSKVWEISSQVVRDLKHRTDEVTNWIRSHIILRSPDDMRVSSNSSILPMVSENAFLISFFIKLPFELVYRVRCGLRLPAQSWSLRPVQSSDGESGQTVGRGDQQKSWAAAGGLREVQGDDSVDRDSAVLLQRLPQRHHQNHGDPGGGLGDPGQVVNSLCVRYLSSCKFYQASIQVVSFLYQSLRP